MAKIETTSLLNDLKKRTEFCIKEAKKLLKQKEEALNNRPNPETWSAAQCLDHLKQYGNYYLDHMETQMAKAQNGPDAFFGPGFIGNMFAKSMIHSPKMTKMQSPADKVPSASNFDKSVVNTFIDQQKQYLDIIKLAESKNLNKIKVPITISKWVKLKLGDTLRVTVYHNERHVIQAVNAIKNN